MSKLQTQLEKIPGIGEKKAQLLISKGVKNVSDLKNKKYYDELPVDTQIELDYKPCKSIPREVAKSLIDLYLPRDWIPVGSYRRGAPKMYDLDFLSLSNLQYTSDMLNIIANLGKKFKVLKEFKQGDKRRAYVLELLFSTACNIIKIDIFKTTEDDLPYALFHYTGNKDFNIRTRAHAKRSGYTLNQYGLFRGDKQVHAKKIKKERDLFDILGITYKTPEERN